MTEFFLGVHRASWLADTDVSLFVSRTSMPTKRFPRATCRWALDSGGFTELAREGRWTVAAYDYARMVRRWHDEVGGLVFACPQDWVCSPVTLAKTGLTVREHQANTVANYTLLREFDDGLPFAPVLQGMTYEDYLTCAQMYADAGVDLSLEPYVALGSIAARQTDLEVRRTVRAFARWGVSLHGLGVKLSGLEAYGEALASADSIAWSALARRAHREGHPSCDPSVRKSCANCLHAALEWRERRVLPLLARERLFVDEVVAA